MDPYMIGFPLPLPLDFLSSSPPAPGVFLPEEERHQKNTRIKTTSAAPAYIMVLRSVSIYYF
jgi:hypothetical protein